MLTVIRLAWADFGTLTKTSLALFTIGAIASIIKLALTPSWDNAADAATLVSLAFAALMANVLNVATQALMQNNRVLRPLARMGYQVTTALQETGSIKVHTAGDSYIIETIGEEA